jgi:hypothetical protein
MAGGTFTRKRGKKEKKLGKKDLKNRMDRQTGDKQG